MRTGSRSERRALFDRRYVPYESRRSYRLALVLFWSLLLYLIFQRSVISLGVVTEVSMVPTLFMGDYYLVNQYLYRVRAPRRGEIVVLRPHPFSEEQYVKRVLAAAGDTIAIRNGDVYVNGKLQVEPFAMGPTFPDMPPQIVAQDFSFVMGDNRPESVDSRYFGPIPNRQIRGRITPGSWFEFW